MFTDSDNATTDRPEQPSRPRLHAFWYVAILLSLAANVYLLFAISHVSGAVTSNHETLGAQLAKLNNDLVTSLEQNRQSVTAVAQESRDSALLAAQQAKIEARKSAAKISAKLAKQEQMQQEAQQQVAGQLNDLKQATTTADSRITEVNGEVTTVKADVASTRADLDKTGQELKRAMGDMGVMSGLIATNQKELGELRELGERNYFEFDIHKGAGVKKVGDVNLELRKSDLKRNRFTLAVVADDKRVEKRDKTINEPVQFYVSGSRQPYEIVVNQVKKDEVIGYLATPKLKLARK